MRDMGYQPGDVVNGHVLGADGVWHPIGAHQGGGLTAQTPISGGYWKRYARRWIKTGVVMGILTAIAVVVTIVEDGGSPGLVDVVLAGVVGLLFWGTLVNFVVAIFPSRARR